MLQFHVLIHRQLVELSLPRRSHQSQVSTVLHNEGNSQRVSNSEWRLLLQRVIKGGSRSLRERLIKTQQRKRALSDSTHVSFFKKSIRSDITASVRHKLKLFCTLARFWKTLRQHLEMVTFMVSLEQMLTTVRGSGRNMKSSP